MGSAYKPQAAGWGPLSFSTPAKMKTLSRGHTREIAFSDDARLERAARRQRRVTICASRMSRGAYHVPTAEQRADGQGWLAMVVVLAQEVRSISDVRPRHADYTQAFLPIRMLFHAITNRPHPGTMHTRRQAYSTAYSTHTSRSSTAGRSALRRSIAEANTAALR